MGSQEKASVSVSRKWNSSRTIVIVHLEKASLGRNRETSKDFTWFSVSYVVTKVTSVLEVYCVTRQQSYIIGLVYGLLISTLFSYFGMMEGFDEETKKDFSEVDLTLCNRESFQFCQFMTTQQQIMLNISGIQHSGLLKEEQSWSMSMPQKWSFWFPLISIIS